MVTKKKVTTTKRRNKKKQTLAEFKAWMEGVEELQPDDWCPNAEQWKTIREKIKGIVEEKVIGDTSKNSSQNTNTASTPVFQPQPMPIQQPMVNGFVPPPQTPGGVPSNAPIVAPTAGQTPSNAPSTPGAVNPMLVPGTAEKPTKTPDIVEDGPYHSSFAG